MSHSTTNQKKKKKMASTEPEHEHREDEEAPANDDEDTRAQVVPISRLKKAFLRLRLPAYLVAFSKTCRPASSVAFSETCRPASSVAFSETCRPAYPVAFSETCRPASSVAFSETCRPASSVAFSETCRPASSVAFSKTYRPASYVAFSETCRQGKRKAKSYKMLNIVLGLLGIIILAANGITIWTLNGNSRRMLHNLAVDLPKKHGRGGQDALQFAGCMPHDYMRKTAELATQFFIDPDTGQPTVSGLILAGSAEFKTELSQLDIFDPQLHAKILKVVEVSFGGEIGFNEAIDHSSDILSDVKFIQEKRLIRKYFKLLSQEGTESTDSNEKQVFAVAGLNDTLYAIEEGVVETLIVWQILGMNMYVFKNSVTNADIIKYLNHEQEADRNNFLDPATSSELVVQEKRSFIEWSRCKHEFVNNQSLEGSQFCRGLGGIGAILRVQKYRSPGTAHVKIRTVSVKIVRMKDEEDGEDEPKLKAIYVFGK